MKNNYPRSHRLSLTKLAFFAALPAVSLLTGCAVGNNVIASTATVIGVQIGQGAADTTPQAKLGYNRAEFAFVPTNRSAPADGKDITGADQSADVLMELHYGNIFSTTNGGIYQRLAVGKNAVTQAGAALMFARDTDGKVDAEQAKAVKAAVEAIKTTAPSIAAAVAPLNKAYLSIQTDAAKKKIFDDAAKTAGFTNYQAFSAKPASVEQIASVRAELEKDADTKTALALFTQP